MTKPTPSAKPLFRAISGQGHRDDSAPLLGEGPSRPALERRALDLYPTGEPDAIRGLLAHDGARIAALGGIVWEPAAGRGDMVREIVRAGLSCLYSDVADHGFAGTAISDFFDHAESPAPVIITNPPFNRITARDGKGAWLRHTLSIPGWRYCALLLSWDWPAGKINGLGDILDSAPFSWCYLIRWKIDFTGQGQAPQRNGWFVWDRDDPRGYGPGQLQPSFRFMDRVDARQGELI